MEQKLDAFTFIVHDMSKFESLVYQISIDEIKTRHYL